MKNNLAYIAGYIDGDGCFFLTKETNPIKYRAKIIISSTNKDVLESFQTGFTAHIRKTTKTKEHWKQSFHWTIRGKYALEFTQNILDYLKEKRADAQIFINFIKNPDKLQKEALIYTMRKNRENLREINESVVEQIRNTKIKGVQDELDYPYLAGFIDAECCLGISTYKPKNRPNPTFKISLQCTNTNPIIFFWLRERFGGSISHVKRNHKNPRHRDQIVWVLSGNKLAPLLPKILPFLRSNKKIVCQKLIEFHETTLSNGGDRQSEDFKSSYQDILSYRQKVVQEIHKLNSKGVINV